MELKKIAVIHTDFPEKFGIPRQSNLADTGPNLTIRFEANTEERLAELKEEYETLINNLINNN